MRQMMRIQKIDRVTDVFDNDMRQSSGSAIYPVFFLIFLACPEENCEVLDLELFNSFFNNLASLTSFLLPRR